MRRDKEYIKRLVEKCISKDLDAWDEFIKFIAPIISSTIQNKFWRLGCDYRKKDIENLRQDILLSIWEDNRLETIKDRNNVIAWICAFSAHIASNYITRLKPVDPPQAHSLDGSLGSLHQSPFYELVRKNMQNDVSSALKSLNYKESLITKLYILYGKKYKEISQMLNIPLGTVLVYAQRAKAKLRRLLRKYK